MRFVDRYGFCFADDEDFEAKHKRNDKGQFDFIRGGKTDKQLSKENNRQTISDFYGKEFRGEGLKGRRAIFKLLEEKRGHIKSAFHRKDIGNIDLVWGNAKAGLAHILMRRIEKRENVKRVILNISNTIANGKAEKDRENERSISIRHRNVRILISKGFKGDDTKRLVVSGYEVSSK